MNRVWSSLLKLLVMAGGLAAAGLLLRLLAEVPATAQGAAWVDRYIRDEGLLGEAIFLAAGGLATALGLPRQSVAFLGGYAFGAVLGTGLGLGAQVLGAALAYLWAGAVGRGWAERRLNGRFGPRLRPMVDRLRRDALAATLALRLLPVGNNLALNLVAGMAGIGLWPFLVGSAIGYLPQTLIFALLGKGVRVDGFWQIAVAGGLFVVSAAIGLWMFRRQPAE